LSSRGGHGTRGLRLFTIAQIAAAVVVAIGAGLLVRSFAHLHAIDRGFDSGNLAVVPILLPESRYPDARARLAFYEQLLPRVAAIPGVVSASAVHVRPGTGAAGLSAGMTFEGQTPAEADTNPWANWEPVTPEYFRTLGVPIIRGRGFTQADTRDAAPVAIVSEAMAQRYWPRQNPLGKRLRFSSGFPWTTVVGVVADVRYRELTRTWLSVYFPAAQFFFFSPGSLVVRAGSTPDALIPAIRETIRALEPAVPRDEATTMDALLSRELARPRAAFTVASLFALMAVILAAVGVYGVMSYEVHQRRWELAVRSALGASPAAIFRDVALRTLTLGGLGTAAGMLAAVLVTRSLRSLLFGVEHADPLIFLAGAGALLGIVLLASSLPARRAAGTDPVAVLRTD
jgi:predicted permease